MLQCHLAMQCRTLVRNNIDMLKIQTYIEIVHNCPVIHEAMYCFFFCCAGVLAFLAMPVGLVSAQKLFLSQTSQDSVSMATTHSTPLLPSKLPHLDWHQDGSSSGEWSSEGGVQPSSIILPTVALHPSAWLHTTQTPSVALEVPPILGTNTVTSNTVSTESQMNQPLEPNSDVVNQGHKHKLVRVPQAYNPGTTSTNQASSSPKLPSTAVPDIDVESTARGAPNPLALMSSSGSDSGDKLTAHHVESQKLSVKEPTDPSQHIPDLQPSSLSFLPIDGDPVLGLREHAQGVPEVAAHHTSTLREVRAVNEPPTEARSVSPGPNTQWSLISTASSEPSLRSQPTVIPNNNTSTNESTIEDGYGQVLRSNSTDSPPPGEFSGNVTAVQGLLFNSSAVEKTSAQGNNSEAAQNSSEPAGSGSVAGRQVPATTQDPWTHGNSSGPTVDSPPSRTPICFSRMDFVWIVLAISVPVSSCCK